MQELPIYRAALRRGLGQWRLDAIDVCGDYDAPPSLKDFRLPPRMLSRGGSGALQRFVGLMKTRPQIDLKACKDCGICVDGNVQVIDRETKRIDYSKMHRVHVLPRDVHTGGCPAGEGEPVMWAAFRVQEELMHASANYVTSGEIEDAIPRINEPAARQMAAQIHIQASYGIRSSTV